MSRKQLTIKQRKFCAEIAKTGNATKSALKVYNTVNYDTAGNIGYENLKKPQIRQTVDDIIAGLENKAKQVLKDGLTAMKQTAYDGEIIESNDIKDNAERRKYVSLIADLAGWKAPKIIENKTMKIVAQFNDMSEEQLTKALNTEMHKLATTTL